MSVRDMSGMTPEDHVSAAAFRRHEVAVPNLDDIKFRLTCLEQRMNQLEQEVLALRNKEAAPP